MLTREKNEMLTRVGRGTPNHFKFLIAWRTLRPFRTCFAGVAFFELLQFNKRFEFQISLLAFMGGAFNGS